MWVYDPIGQPSLSSCDYFIIIFNHFFYTYKIQICFRHPFMSVRQYTSVCTARVDAPESKITIRTNTYNSFFRLRMIHNMNVTYRQKAGNTTGRKYILF